VQPGGWINVGMQEHPNTVPMAFSVDGQFQNIAWVPTQAGPANVQWGAPPNPPPNTVITGGGTDPHGVALDVLGHIPLPPIQLRVNPDVGHGTGRVGGELVPSDFVEPLKLPDPRVAHVPLIHIEVDATPRMFGCALGAIGGGHLATASRIKFANSVIDGTMRSGW